MYDTIHLYITKDKLDHLDIMGEVPANIDISLLCDTGDYKYYTGKLKNLRVTVSEAKVTIKGSWAKYHFDNNFESLTIEDTASVIDSIGNALNIPLKDAIITRIDFGRCFKVNHPPKLYFKYLGDCKYFERLLQSNSLYYKNINRQMHIYDKVDETNSKRSTIPSFWKNSYVLRYEMRYLKKLSKLVNEPKLLCHNLIDENFYEGLVHNYIAGFNSIFQLKDFDLDTSNMSTPSDLIDAIYSSLINPTEYNHIMEVIDEAKEKQVYDRPEYYSRVKSHFRKLHNMRSHTSTMINELSDKVLNYPYSSMM